MVQISVGARLAPWQDALNVIFSLSPRNGLRCLAPFWGRKGEIWRQRERKAAPSELSMSVNIGLRDEKVEP